MRGISIILVDDNDDHAFIIETCLRKADPEITFQRFSDGESAVAALACEDKSIELPDIILMDINMPGMDGVEVTRLLKANSHTARTPVIMLSTSSSANDYLRALDTHANSYMVKDSKYSNLLESMAKLVHYWKDVHLRISELK